MKSAEFLTLLIRTKVLFVPNRADASPKILTQALTANTAILVNKDIIGGWNYVNNQTGSFFSNENDVVNELKNLI